jgi:hypothetical protein
MRLEQRRLQPDAMLEDPAHRRRYFIEYETGTATINEAKKSTSTRAKLGRCYAPREGGLPHQRRIRRTRPDARRCETVSQPQALRARILART